MHPKDVAEDSNKTVFNEQMLAKLLEAAYVVQEHNRAKNAAAAERPETARNETPVSDSISSEADFVAALRAATELVADEPLRNEPIQNEPPQSAPVSTTTRAIAVTAVETSESSAAARDDYASTLSLIVETQRQMQERPQDLNNPMAFIAERAAQIARANGAAIGIVESEKLHYRATAGLMNPPNDVSKERALSALCLKTGQVLRCRDVNSSNVSSGNGLDSTECKRLGIQAMIAVPVFRDGVVGGALELYYATAQSFTEQDVHTAQLMAGLVADALAREEEATRRKSLAGERALMLEALERLQPNLAALVDASTEKSSVSKSAPASALPASTTPTKISIVCSKCGHDLLDEEQFCGKCGAARGDYQAPSMQSRVASAWHMQEALKKQASPPANGNSSQPESPTVFDDAEFEKMLSSSLEKEMPELFQPPELRSGKMWPETLEPTPGSEMEASELESSPLKAAASAGEHAAEATAESATASLAEAEEESAIVTALAKPDRNLDWSSAASAREFLEQMARERSNGLTRFWQARRGDFYLALAVILVAVVIRWGIWSNHPVGATGKPAAAVAQQHRPAPDADRSWFDRALISLGLAEAPQPAEYKGNPATEVWVDLHTALYYCPGTDLYGKTPKGKFATQRDAQLDQFEPAYRKACD
jgi:hypothetical protein